MGKYTLATLLPPDIFFAIKTTAFYPVLYQFRLFICCQFTAVFGKAINFPVRTDIKTGFISKRKKPKR